MLRKRVLSAVLTGLFAAMPLIATPAVASAEATEAAVQASLDQELAKRAAVSPAAVHVCYAVHVADYGWLDTVCDAEEAGVPAQGKRIEAIRIGVNGGGAGVCYTPHLQDIGWVNSESCNLQEAGTIGQSRRLEALKIRGLGTRLCYTAMGQGYEYQDVRCQNEVVGTIGQSRYMSGISIWVA